MICEITTLVPLPVVHVWNICSHMIPEKEIKDWWDRKNVNYLQNYARRNKLTVAEAKARFFTESMKNLSNQCHNSWSNFWMRKPDAIKEQQLLEKLIRGGRTNLSEWFEKIADDFCEEQAVKDRTSVETVKEKFYTDFTEQFLCSLPTLLFKFLIENEQDTSLNLVHCCANRHQIPIGRRSRRSGRNSL